MRGGNNRKPDAVKELEGTSRKDRRMEGAPQLPSVLVPPPPKGMKQKERAAWLELAPQIDALGVYAVSDRTALRLLCKCLAMVDDAETAESPTALVRMAQVAAGLLQRFGLDPASRSKVAATPPKKADDIGDFLSGKVRGLSVVK
jgi:phage terminase small subunit